MAPHHNTSVGFLRCHFLLMIGINGMEIVVFSPKHTQDKFHFAHKHSMVELASVTD